MGRLPTIIEDPQVRGRVIGVNRKRLDEIPYWLVTDLPNNIVTVPANQSSPIQTMILSGVGPGRFVNFGIESTGAALMFLRILDGSTPRGLMNGALHINTICGNVGQPFYLPEALYVDELRSLQVTFTDISGAANAIRFVAHGTKFASQQADPTMERVRQRLESKQYLSVPYFYTFDTGQGQGAVTIPAGGTVTVPITIGSDTYFQLMTLSAVFTSPDFDIDLLDAQTGESLIQAPAEAHYPIAAGLILGNGNFPYRFHEPRTFQYGQKIIVTMTDRSLAPNTVHLALGGRALTIRMWG